ncbi:hypothetical protein [uncultured Treponema sp.]|uniref:hypothetical protein n=1 Tax=uncultured Treponema sp. TaxID=162155 RepID=UPI0028ECB745|nr:hypothetical protein [uncultured Treponema sp.]
MKNRLSGLPPAINRMVCMGLRTGAYTHSFTCGMLCAQHGAAPSHNSVSIVFLLYKLRLGLSQGGRMNLPRQSHY